jgi:nucleoside-diphosphate-sugar epimerase
MAANGSFAFIDGGRQRTSTTHVHNLVHALVLALTHGEGGRSYFVADEGTRTVRAFLSELVATQGVRLPERNVPGVVARAAAFVVEGLYRLFRVKRAPPMTRFAVTMMSRSVTVKTDRARAELGYAPVIDVAEGIRALAACVWNGQDAGGASPTGSYS